MKTLPALLVAIIMTTAALPAADPSTGDAAPHKAQVASFLARVAYAKANAQPVLHENKGGPLSCEVYTVTQGPGGAPGYVLVVARDARGGNTGDIVIVCDTAAVDPAHSIKCSGHTMAAQRGFLLTGGEGLAIQLGLGIEDAVLSVTGPSKNEPM